MVLRSRLWGILSRQEGLYIYVYVYVYMSKLINISDEVYARLKAMKGSDSYSVVIKGLLSRKSNKEEVLKQFGKGGVDEKRMKELKKGWKKWSERYA